MKIKKFIYNEKLREVIVAEENATSIKGIDISYIEDPEERQSIRESAESIELDENGKFPEDAFNKFNGLKYFRNFSKSKVSPMEE